MHSKPNILLLGAHRWRRQSVVEMARESGFDPILFLFEGESLPAELSDIVSPSRIIRQTTGTPISARSIAEKAERHGRPWYVLGLDDYVCPLAAEISAYSAAPSMPPTAAIETLEKHSLRRRWNELCRTNPRLHPVPFRLWRYSDSSFETKIAEEGDLAIADRHPLIIKPNALDASIGIQKSNSWTGVDAAVAKIRNELAPLARDVVSMGIHVSPSILIEQRIPRSGRLHPGAEFSVEFLSVRTHADGGPQHTLLGITQKYIDPETFVEVAHCFPSETFPESLIDVAARTTTTLLEQFGVNFGISHWEYIVCEDDRLALVEAQLRPAGDRIMDLILRATGQNPFHALFSALRQPAAPIPANFSAKQKAAVFFPLPRNRVIGKLTIVREDLPGAPALGRDYFVDLESGHDELHWGGKTYWHSRMISIVTEGENFAAARKKCDGMLSYLGVHALRRDGNTESTSLILPIA